MGTSDAPKWTFLANTENYGANESENAHFKLNN